MDNLAKRRKTIHRGRALLIGSKIFRPHQPQRFYRFYRVIRCSSHGFLCTHIGGRPRTLMDIISIITHKEREPNFSPAPSLTPTRGTSSSSFHPCVSSKSPERRMQLTSRQKQNKTVDGALRCSAGKSMPQRSLQASSSRRHQSAVVVPLEWLKAVISVLWALARLATQGASAWIAFKLATAR